MKCNLFSFIKSITPPIIVEWIAGWYFGWNRSYASWEKAKQHASGYEDELILDRVKNSLLKVKNGQGAYERSSVLFDHIEYAYPLLASLMWIATQKNGRLNVLDFGGALGTTYFQNKYFLDSLQHVRWNIVEQPHFVKCGQQYFQDEQLHYYETIDDCLNFQKSNVIILSGVLQYLESPYIMLESVFQKNFDYILIDKIPLSQAKKDRVVIQHVPKHIYPATIPIWFLNKSNFTKLFDQYEQIFEFDAIDGKLTRDVKSYGFLFKRK